MFGLTVAAELLKKMAELQRPVQEPCPVSGRVLRSRAIGSFYAAKALFICLPYFSEDAQRLLSHAAQVATACASTLRAEFAAVDRPGLTALQQLVGVAWSGLADLCDGFWEFLACISMRMATLGCNVVLCQKYKATE